MNISVGDVTRDLIAEQDDLDDVVASLSPDDFSLATPSPRWTVADQLGHLAFFDHTAALAISDPDGFAAHRAELFATPAPENTDLDEATLGEYRAMDPAELVAAWRAARAELASAAATLGEKDRVEWYGPSMGAKSFLTARLMEAWAHGQDIADTIGASRAPSERLVHIAQLGFITQKWSFLVRGEEPLPVEVAVVLDVPGAAAGDQWTFGPADAPDRVSGRAEDFCLVVTQRRNVADTDLRVVGEHAERWMANAQAFAGGPTSGPEPTGVT
jgi:uncharacterized protein (TIGR03084 family)